MARYLRNKSGRRSGVLMSVKEYNDITTVIAELRIQNSIQAELLRRKKVMMLAPQKGSSIWHPN